MFLQIPHDPEHLATRGAAERLLPGVKPQVCLQIFPQAEAFAAPGAGVRPLISVEPRVAPEALPQSECLRANRTRVWFFSRVEALVPPEDLPPLERLFADVANVAVTGVGDHFLKPPNAVSAGAEAAEAMASVRTSVAAEVFRQRPSRAALGDVILQLHLRLRRLEHVHQLNLAGPHQLQVQSSQFQLHVQVALRLLWHMHLFPNPNLSRGDGAVRRGRAVGGALGGADTGLLRLRLEDQRANKVNLLPRNDITCIRLDHERLLVSRRALRGSGI